MSTLCAVGIDPGLSGAIGLITKSGNHLDIEVFDMPTLELKVGKNTRRRIDLTALNNLMSLVALSATVAAVEDLSGRPSTVVTKTGQRIAQKGLWEQGWNCAAPVVLCVAHQIPHQLIKPAIWKKRVGVPADKHATKLHADRLFPGFSHLWPLKKHDGRAEAVLLAHYLLEFAQ